MSLNRIHSGSLMFAPTQSRGPEILARDAQIHELTVEISSKVVVQSEFSQRCCAPVTVAAAMNRCEE